jgi:hypothetical protein
MMSKSAVADDKSRAGSAIGLLGLMQDQTKRKGAMVRDVNDLKKLWNRLRHVSI